MGAVIDQAKAIADHLKAAGLNATSDVRGMRLPGLLVIPVPALNFTTLDNSAVEATFTVYALAPGVGDLVAAAQLEKLVLAASKVVPVVSATPTSYQIPGASDPVPAYAMELTEDVLDV